MSAQQNVWASPFATTSFPTSTPANFGPSFGVANVVEIVARTTWDIVFSESGLPPDVLTGAAYNLGVIFDASAAVADRGFFVKRSPNVYPQGPAIQVSTLDSAGAPVATDGVLWIQATRTGPLS